MDLTNSHLDLLTQILISGNLNSCELFSSEAVLGPVKSANVGRYVVMKRMISISSSRLFVWLILFFFITSSYADVSARLSRQTTTLDEPVRLTLQIEGESDGKPDLRVLEKDFEILGRSQQQSISIINGNMTKKQGLVLTLLPKSLGSLTIPPIPVGSDQSQPLTLEVVESISGEEQSGGNEVFIQTELSKSEAYLQEEVILTVKVYQPLGVFGETLTEPQSSLDDTQLQRLQEERYPAEHEGQNYQVIERSYSIQAYQTGELQLSGIRYRGRSGGNRGSSIFNLMRDPFSNTKPQQQRFYRASAESVTLKIKPVPSSYTGKLWLPARNLRIVESGLESVGPITAGKSVSRRIMLFADGLTASQLPEITLRLPPGIKQYPERPRNTDNNTRNGLSGSRQIAIALMAMEEGSYELPAIEIPWWNTEMDRQETARLDPVTLDVLPALGSGGQKHQQTQEKGLKAQSQTRKAEAETPPAFESADEETGSIWLTWVLGAGWLGTLLAWWLSRKGKRSVEKPPVATPPTAAAKETLTEIIQQLEHAYVDGDRDAARLAWLRWGRYRWPEHPPSNLNRLAERSPTQIALAVIALDRTFYSPAEQNDWKRFTPGKLLEKKYAAKIRPLKSSDLAPLNP
jgi:hypothetical protein